MSNSSKNYAIFGGTFDPIHKAHVSLADYAVKELNLQELYFMPAYVSPFKQGKQITSPQMRLEMIKTVLDYNSAFRVSDYEILKKQVSYTIETLDYFNNLYEGNLHFIVGFDALATIDTWYKGTEILNKYPIITACRPGNEDEIINNKIVSFRNNYNAKIHVLNMEEMDISSSLIRDNINKNISVKGLLLPKTEEYIIEKNLYKY